MLVAHLCTANTSSDSPEDTPLVTPNSPIFPSLGSAVELTTDATINSEPTKVYGSLFAPVPKPLPLRPSFGVDLTSPTRCREFDGRLREPSASGEERAQALGTVRKMLEELRVSPDYRPAPPTSSGTWTPIDRYVPPWKLNQLRESNSRAGCESSDSFSKQVPKVNLNDETLDEDEQLAMLKDLEKEGANASARGSIHDAVQVVEKLTGPNWPSWSFWIQRKVHAANRTIWGHIDGSCTRESSDEWDADEAAIYCALFSSLDVGIINEQVRRCTTAKEIWELLELLYKEKPTPENRAVDLIREIATMCYYEEHDIQRYLHRFERIVDELQESSYPVPLGLVKQFVLSSFPGNILKHVISLQTKEHSSMSELCQDIMELKKYFTIETHPSESPRRHIGALLPPDLRSYKYIGDGNLPDGALYLRSKKTCGACLSSGHKAYALKCPQTEVRLGLWGFQQDRQRPWDKCKGKDLRQGLGVGKGRVSGPTTPSSSAPNCTRSSSAGGISVRSEHGSPRSRMTSEGTGIVSSRAGQRLAAFEFESWR